ncbi:MAG: sarcosine oxidase subunit gamma family protein, partial [Betaproteobacteria bacterium]
MLERRSPLATHSYSIPGTRVGPAGFTETRVRLAERRPLAILQVTAFAKTTQDAASQLAAALAIAPPLPNHWSGSRERNVRYLGPGVWQVVAPEGALPDVVRLRSDLAAVATVVDLSHARTALQIAGPEAPAVLAKHCGFDLHPTRFPTGGATNTRFGHIGITLVRLADAPTFELLVF